MILFVLNVQTVPGAGGFVVQSSAPCLKVANLILAHGIIIQFICNESVTLNTVTPENQYF